MAIPENIIDQIRDRVDIVEIISGYVPLKKTGRSYKAPCPFHHEKTPSFIVSSDKQIYHCFGCGAGGNVFSFLMKHENIQFPEAVEMLAEKAGIALPRFSGQNEGKSSLAGQLYTINDAACGFFQACLESNSFAKDYLASRGVGGEAIKKFKIGFAPNSWEALLNFFKKKGLNAGLLEKTGLVVSNEKGGHYDRFRNRITFPITDIKEKVLGFGARVMDSSLPKYINSPETVIYSKGRNLYGLNLSREFIKKEGHALIVEGYLDFIIPYQAGVRNIIATLGTALTIDQVKLLKRFTQTVIMVYDPDEAGENASLRNLDLFISENVNVYIAELASGLDPDTYIRKFGTEDFLKTIKSSKNIFDYKLDKLNKRFNMNTANGKAAIVGEMLPTISKIGNEVLKSELVRKLADRLSTDEDAIKLELKKSRKSYGERGNAVVPAKAVKDVVGAELMILALLIESKDYANKIGQMISLEEFKNSSIRDIVEAIFSLRKEGKEINPVYLINHLGNNTEAANMVSEASSIGEIIKDKDKALEDCVLKIKKDNLKDRLTRIQEAIKAAHIQKDDQMVKNLVSEYNELIKINRT